MGEALVAGAGSLLAPAQLALWPLAFASGLAFARAGSSPRLAVAVFAVSASIFAFLDLAPRGSALLRYDGPGAPAAAPLAAVAGVSLLLLGIVARARDMRPWASAALLLAALSLLPSLRPQIPGPVEGLLVDAGAAGMRILFALVAGFGFAALALAGAAIGRRARAAGALGRALLAVYGVLLLSGGYGAALGWLLLRWPPTGVG